MNNSALFEDNFIERTYPSIVSDASTAFAELVANAWDAGATRVSITIPENETQKIIIEDNGSGMNDDEFHKRWMVFAYNRVSHQGPYVDFISEENKNTKRIAYGRNGIGRHALLCFDNRYTIETWKNGTANVYEIVASGGKTAFSIINHDSFPKAGQGTKIIIKASRKWPNPDEIIRTLGYRFLFDPQFEVYVNEKKVESNNTLEANHHDILHTDYGDINIDIYLIPDGEKNTAQNGIALWVNGRLVGNPSWNLGEYRIEDARRRFALRHIIIAKADYLIDDVGYDWSSFKKTEKVNTTFDLLTQYFRKYRVEYYRGKTNEVRDNTIRKNKDEIRSLSIPSMYKLKDFFDSYLEKKPDIESDDLDLIVTSLLNMLKNERGISLLTKLSVMPDSSIAELDRILDEWSISDIQIVLDEIDIRIKIIDAIQKLCSDPNTDELHVLHPLVSQARWLFGIEYDNPNFTYNRRLSTVVKNLLGGILKENTTINWNKRPDLVFTSNATFSVTCTDSFDENNFSRIDNILIIELKKGSFTVGRKEINQAEEYVDSLHNGNEINSSSKIKAYVIGDSIEKAIAKYKKLESYGEVYAYTYSELVQTAEKRLFGLKAKLEEHFEQFTGDDYVNMILNEPEQLKLKM